MPPPVLIQFRFFCNLLSDYFFFFSCLPPACASRSESKPRTPCTDFALLQMSLTHYIFLMFCIVLWSRSCMCTAPAAPNVSGPAAGRIVRRFYVATGVLANTKSSIHYGFELPLAVLCWKELINITTNAFLLGKVSTSHDVLRASTRALLGLGALVVDLPLAKSVLQAQHIRLYVGCLPLSEDSFVIMTDSDLFPVRKLWFVGFPLMRRFQNRIKRNAPIRTHYASVNVSAVFGVTVWPASNGNLSFYQGYYWIIYYISAKKTIRSYATMKVFCCFMWVLLFPSRECRLAIVSTPDCCARMSFGMLFASCG